MLNIHLREENWRKKLYLCRIFNLSKNSVSIQFIILLISVCFMSCTDAAIAALYYLPLASSKSSVIRNCFSLH